MIEDTENDPNDVSRSEHSAAGARSNPQGAGGSAQSKLTLKQKERQRKQ